jgi:polar amino acid transport system substrate-binding protein
MTMVRKLALYFLIGAATPVFSQVEPLRFMASSSWTMPYGDVQADRIQGGIVFDIAQAVGESLKLPVSFLVIPRNRIDAAVIAGDVDVRCYSNPAWTKFPDEHLWSKSLFEAPDVIVGRRPGKSITSLDQLPNGTPLGTVLGFVYPTLEDRLTDGRLVRDNASDGEKNILKLATGRFNYAVSNSLAVAWYLRQNPKADIANWRLPLDKGDFYCGVVKTARTDPQRILTAIERLKSSGQLDKILAKYR